MIAVPAVTPVTIPVAEPTVTAALVVLHTPPAIGSLSVTDDPMHTAGGPVTAEGVAFTVTLAKAVQPVVPAV